MESLHENVTANLPKHCKLRPDIWKQPSSKASEPLHSAQRSASESDQPQQTSPQLADTQCSDTCGAGNSSNAMSHAASLTSRENSDAQLPATEVSVAELDWAQDPTFLSPPYDVVLIADVVSSMIPCGACHLMGADCLHRQGLHQEGPEA